MRRLLSFGSTSRERALFVTWVVFCVGLSTFFVSQAVSDGGPEHQLRQPRPIDLGVSGNLMADCQAGFVGTLGSLISGPVFPALPEWGPVVLASALLAASVFLLRRRHLRPIGVPLSLLIVLSSAFYARAVFAVNPHLLILSNNHVLADENRASMGDPILQPACETGTGPLCAPDCLPPDGVGQLAGYDALVIDGPDGTENDMDAAVAKIVPGTVKVDGSILDVGPPGIAPADPVVDMLVKKSGRTTGLTHGEIAAIDMTVDVVGYETGTTTATFVGQIRIVPVAPTTAFCLGGDSGSLVVKEESTCPAPVGLFFAGNDTGTHCLATPIQTVLDRFAATMVGCTPLAGGSSPSSPNESSSYGGLGAAAVENAIDTKRARQAELLSLPGAVGVGVGRSQTTPGEPAIEVYVEADSPALRSAVPSTVDGVDVQVVVTGPIRAH